MSTYQVNEIFDSIQGEGVLAGVPATFIRLQGCTVGCPWCDTKYTWAKGGTKMTVDEILMKINRKHVVITGGEPTLHNLDDLITTLRNTRCYTQLETSGQQWMKGIKIPDWITWSPKESLQWWGPEPFFDFADEVKWVVDETLRLETVEHLWHSFEAKLNRVNSMPYFVLMPEGCPPRPEMVEKTLAWLADWQFWRYGDRLQYRIGVR